MSDPSLSATLGPTLGAVVQRGQVIADKYLVDRIIGTGGMGVVVAATHLQLERPVAIKLVRPELVADPLAMERLLLEAKAAAKIQSEHVARVLDVGTLAGGSPFIVMEYLEGEDLEARLNREGPLAVSEAVDWVLQVCEALAEAHRQQIIHRDIKPANLFLARQPTGGVCAKLVDFGISKNVGPEGAQVRLTAGHLIVGSAHCMAPEQMRGEPVDERADIWSLGTLLYEMVSGLRAFEGEQWGEVCAKVLEGRVRPLTELGLGLPSEFSELVARCLSRDPAARFRDVAELSEALAPFGGGGAAVSLGRVRSVLRGPGAFGTPPVIEPDEVIDLSDEVVFAADEQPAWPAMVAGAAPGAFRSTLKEPPDLPPIDSSALRSDARRSWPTPGTRVAPSPSQRGRTIALSGLGATAGAILVLLIWNLRPAARPPRPPTPAPVAQPEPLGLRPAPQAPAAPPAGAAQPSQLIAGTGASGSSARATPQVPSGPAGLASASVGASPAGTVRSAPPGPSATTSSPMPVLRASAPAAGTAQAEDAAAVVPAGATAARAAATLSPGPGARAVSEASAAPPRAASNAAPRAVPPVLAPPPKPKAGEKTRDAWDPNSYGDRL